MPPSDEDQEVTTASKDLPAEGKVGREATYGNRILYLEAKADEDGTIPLGITYRVPSVDKSKVQIVYLQGGSWTNVTTVPDPNPSNPYVSASIANAGTYALVQRP